jgi:hypothetical protein
MFKLKEMVRGVVSTMTTGLRDWVGLEERRDVMLFR